MPLPAPFEIWGLPRGFLEKRSDCDTRICDFSKAMRSQVCAFCRAHTVHDDRNRIEKMARLEKRIELGDSHAMCEYAGYFDTKVPDSGSIVIEKDDHKAVEFLERAYDLGSAQAAVGLSAFCKEGRGGFFPPSKEMSYEYLKAAALRGSIASQHNLAHQELSRYNYEGALFWWKVAGSGDDLAITNYREAYELGRLSKEKYDAAFQQYQLAKEAMNSFERERFRRAVLEESGVGLSWQ